MKLAYSVSEAAEITGMSESSVYRAIQLGELQAIKPSGSKYIVTHKHLTEYLDGLERAAS